MLFLFSLLFEDHATFVYAYTQLMNCFIIIQLRHIGTCTCIRFRLGDFLARLSCSNPICSRTLSQIIHHKLLRRNTSKKKLPTTGLYPTVCTLWYMFSDNYTCNHDLSALWIQILQIKLHLRFTWLLPLGCSL